MVNFVERLWNELAPVLACVIAATNSRSLTGLFLSLSLSLKVGTTE